jgi:hypothetical protein
MTAFRKGSETVNASSRDVAAEGRQCRVSETHEFSIETGPPAPIAVFSEHLAWSTHGAVYLNDFCPWVMTISAW